MTSRRAYAYLLVLVVVVFVAAFALGRALRADATPRTPPPVVDAPSPRLGRLGPPAELPRLRPQRRVRGRGGSSGTPAPVPSGAGG